MTTSFERHWLNAERIKRFCFPSTDKLTTTLAISEIRKANKGAIIKSQNPLLSKITGTKIETAIPAKIPAEIKIAENRGEIFSLMTANKDAKNANAISHKREMQDGTFFIKLSVR